MPESTQELLRAAVQPATSETWLLRDLRSARTARPANTRRPPRTIASHAHLRSFLLEVRAPALPAAKALTQTFPAQQCATIAPREKSPNMIRPIAIRAAPATTAALATYYARSAGQAFTHPQALALACTATPESSPPRVHRRCAHPALRVPSLRRARLSAILA